MATYSVERKCIYWETCIVSAASEDEAIRKARNNDLEDVIDCEPTDVLVDVYEWSAELQD